MSPLFSPDPAINGSRERPSVLCVVVITASSNTLQPPCTPALGHWEKLLTLQELLMDTKDPDLNANAQKSVVINVEREAVGLWTLNNLYFYADSM